MVYGLPIFAYTVSGKILSVRNVWATIGQRSGVVPVQCPDRRLICCPIFSIIMRASGMAIREYGRMVAGGIINQ